MTPRRFVVVGAGITGLAAAFEWRRRRPDDEIVVLEAGDRIGGKLHRVELAGHWYDTGAEAVLARVPEAVRLIEDLGLGDQLVAPATTQASVVLPDGRHPLPAGTVLGVPASADGLDGFLSPDGVARVRAEAVAAAAAPRRRRRRRRPAARAARRRGGRPAGRAAARRRLRRPRRRALAGGDDAGPGRAAADRRFRAGRRGGRPGRRGAQPGRRRRAGVRHRAGRHRRPARRRWSRPPRAEVRLRTPAHGLRRTATGFELSIGPAAAPELLTADAVLVTAPAAKAARLLAGSVPGAVEPLQGIPYASMAVVAMAFPAQDVDAGSGLLVPPVTGRLVKGVTVSSAKWPHLAGGEALLVRSSVGRFRDESELQRSDDDLDRRRRRRRRRPAGPLPAGAAGDAPGPLGRGAAAVPGRAPGAGRRRPGGGQRGARAGDRRAPPSRAWACRPASATPSTRSTPCSEPLADGRTDPRGRMGA